MYNPLISVIVPMYKVEKFVKRAIESVLVQSYVHFELILVDDGSPDKCGEIAEEYAKKDDRITVIHQENGGLSLARNAALDVASGEYIFFLDADDYILENTLEELLKESKDGFFDIVVGGWLYLLPGNILKDGETRPYQDDIDAIRRDILTMKLFNFACGRLIKRRLFENLRFIPHLVAEDIYICPTLFFRAKTACVLSKNYYVYSKENIHSLSNGIDIKNTIKFKYGRYFGLLQHANFAKNFDTKIEEICIRMALREGFKAFLYNQILPALTLDEIQKIKDGTKKYQKINLKLGQKFIRYCILKHFYLMLKLLGKIEVIAFKTRIYFRARRWKKYDLF